MQKKTQMFLKGDHCKSHIEIKDLLALLLAGLLFFRIIQKSLSLLSVFEIKHYDG